VQRTLSGQAERVARGLGIYCSQGCAGKGRKFRPTADRFWEHVSKTDGGCWLWTGATYGGYGVFGLGPDIGRKTVLAHRFSWEIANGKIPDGLLACHECDKNYPVGDTAYRRCVNPAHLFLGTDADNQADKVAKNRQTKGEGSWNAILTEGIVRESRRRYAAGEVNMVELADELRVSESTVWSFIHRQSWKHVD
jgi:hypothetical protein